MRGEGNMGNAGMSDFCIKCNCELSDKEKAMGIPLCQGCIESLVEFIGKKISRIDEKRIGEQVDNFSRFILSSGYLMGLDEALVSKCCFYGFMKSVTDIESKNIAFAEKILKQAIVFINKELEEIELKKERNGNPNDQLRLFMEEIMDKDRKTNGGKDNKKDEKND